jgi:hypothetical protein
MTSKSRRRHPTAADLVLVDATLSLLFRRAKAGLDLGLVLLLESPRDRYPNYVVEHIAKPMRAAALVLRVVVAEFVSEPALGPFESIEVETEAFVRSLGELENFSSLGADQLRESVERLGTAFRRLRDSFIDIAERLEFEPSMLADPPVGGALDYDAILRQLYDDLTAERGRDPAS